MAFGVLAAARERGLAVPGDLSVIGVDGHDLAGLFALTTIDQFPHAQGEHAGDAILAAVGAGPAASSAGSVGPGGPAGSLEAAASGEQPNTPASLPVALVTRGTTAPPRPPH